MTPLEENARAAGRTLLEHRWNVAASRAGFSGSEYIDDPELVFRRVTEAIMFARKLGATRRPRR